MPSEVNIDVTVISFLVRVPVLSEQITLAHPESKYLGFTHIYTVMQSATYVAFLQILN